MPTLADIVQDPHFVNANPATKSAIFDKYSAADPNYSSANPATQQAIKAKFGVVNNVAPLSVDQSDTSFLGRAKNIIIAPKSERDATFAGAIDNGVRGIPEEIGKQFMDNIHSMGRHINPQTPQEAMDAAPIGGIVPKPLLDAAGAIMSPVTGALTSLVGRPIEQATGIRREIIGNVISALVPFGGEAKVAKVASELKPMAAEAIDAGYVLHPKMISDKPGIVANTLAGMGGKVKTAQAASVKNQEITNALAAKSLGLPPDAPLTPQAFKDVRAEAGKAYEAVKTAVPNLAADQEYTDAVKSLGGANSQAAAHFPKTMNNTGIKDLSEELAAVKSFPTAAGMELVKELRANANSNLKAIGDPSAHALGLAQRQAADAVDGLIERNIANAGGDAALVGAYKNARKLIAKSYDLEGATNIATGNVNALGLGRLADKGKPLTDELATIARTAEAFPKAMQPVDKFGGVEAHSVLDFFGAAGAAAHGNPGIVGAILGRPFARAAVLSKPIQEAVVAGAKGGKSPIRVPVRAPAGNALYQLSQQNQ